MSGRGKKTGIALVLFVILCICLGISTGFLGFKTIQDNSKYNKQTKRMNTLLKENNNKKEEIQKLQAEVSDKAAYIDEWEGVYQSLEKKEENPGQTGSSKSSYANQYPDMSVTAGTKSGGESDVKIVHLTFDDGPSKKTGQVLDTLDKYNVKATFFVTYTEDPEVRKYYKEIVNRGHTIAVHTASHDYKKIYSSVEAYLEDFHKVYQTIVDETGVKPVLFRYPGGSLKAKSGNAGLEINEEMKRRGFIYVDWNVSTGDGGNQATESSILDWAVGGVAKHRESIVLMHDTREPTVAILPEVVKQLKESGCVFEPLNANSKKIQIIDKIY